MDTTGKNQDKKKRHVPRMPDRQYAYFRDDQITFLCTHPQNELTEDDLRAWRTAIEPALSGATIAWPPRLFSFQVLRDDEYQEEEYEPWKKEAQRITNTLSILVCDMENAPQDPLEFIEFISSLSKPGDPDNPDDGLIVNKEFAGLRVKAISPNWLSSGASQGGATGGPGGWPVPYRGNPSRAPYQFRQLISDLKKEDNDNKKANIYGDGEGVDVVILDTAPSPHELVAAYKECKGWHPLISTLLGPNGKLKLYPASYEEHVRMGSTSLNEHDYKMADHGLFAAGIIHSIVPKATIHLIEALNPLGVGDLESLVSGFHKIFKNRIYDPGKPEQKVVINCSWMLEPPIVADHRRDPDSEFEQRVMEMVSSYRNDAFALKDLCELFANMGKHVIAAAGNDWKGAGDRTIAPATRYPAAFLRTYGVGALPKDSKPGKNGKYEASKYSNLADIPENVKKITTLGGEEGEGQGVLGLYLGEFPGCEAKPNCTKWAWWAGTSFATPILTATIASVLSGPHKPGTIQAAVGALYDKHIIDEQKKTEADEDVMEAAQDY
jgi:hypothetical protein